MKADRYDIAAALGLASALGLSYPVAAILARRGHTDRESAARFLAADEVHDPGLLPGMDAGVAIVARAIETGKQVTVYGDFDADGVCATAILVACVRDLGGRCDWFIPDRIADGYGLNPDAIRMLAGRGTACLVTVDCGVTAAGEVELARELGLDVVVSDHHQFDPEALPDCPVIHPGLGGYPFPHLCGAAVAAKLSCGLRQHFGQEPGEERDLDLVALATVADVMPLTGENRRMVKQGIEVARRAGRPGMAALLDQARVPPDNLTAEDLGFRLAPRINAAGRMYRADAGVELFLGESTGRAAEIARELGEANAERRRVEREVLAEAGRVLAKQEPGPVIVVAGEGWHPGVVGIVASRLVQAHGLPSVVISLDGDHGRGSARSVPGLDLHAALGEVSAELLGYGGHAAAAGLQIETSRIGPFREALGAVVAARIGTEPEVEETGFDVVAGGEDLGLDLARELEHLGPFGNGNPSPTLLIPGVRITGQQEIGEGRHCRFTVVSGANRASGICFGRSSLEAVEGQRVDLLAELGVNHWNGRIEPRLLARQELPVPEGSPLPGCGADEWWDRFEASLAEGRSTRLPAPDGRETDAVREVIRWRGLPGVTVGELVGSGSRVAILCIDAVRRWRALGGAEGIGRFNPDARTGGFWEGSPRSATLDLVDLDVVLTDYAALARLPDDALDRFDDVVMLDRPSHPAEFEQVRSGPGRLHLVGGEDELEFALAATAHRFDLTADLRDLYRAVRESGAIDDGPRLVAEPLRMILAGESGSDRSPERAAMLVGVLGESGLLQGSGLGPGRDLGVVSSVKVELTTSTIFVTQNARYKERIEFLRRSQTTR